MSEINSNYQLKIFPNPFNDNFTVATTFTNNYEFSLTDLNGRFLLKTFSQEKNLEIDNLQLENGIYFYTIKTEDGLSYNGKIIKN